VFNVGPEKLLLLFVIALLVLGPTKLPDAARQLGKALGEFRKVSGRLQTEVRDALADPKDALSAAVSDLRKEFPEVGGFGLGGLAMSAPVGEQPSPAPESAAAQTSPGYSVSDPTRPLPPSPDDPSLN
jgi:sec-independent protein translocase protein TatB